MHISLATISVLRSRGWITPTDMCAAKMFQRDDLSGMLGDGTREILVRFDDFGRYVDVLDGFRLARDFDSRDYAGRPEALADAIEKAAEEIFQ